MQDYGLRIEEDFWKKRKEEIRKSESEVAVKC
jgi:hypothetical protein